MKHSIILLSALLMSISIFSQEKQTGIDKIRVDAGFVLLGNRFNGDNYHDFLYNGAPDAGDDRLAGGMLKLTIPGWRKIDLIMGTMAVFGTGQLRTTTWVPGNTNAVDYRSNGGGVFFGLGPKTHGKHFGLTSEIALGAFSFKQYTAIFDNTTGPTLDKYDKKASYGLGGMSSLGFYLKMGSAGINPSVNAIFSGGSGASFFFYGMVIPLFVEF